MTSKHVFIVLSYLLLNAITFVPHVSDAACHSNGPNSPPFNPKGTPATLTLNGFGPEEEGGAPSECDGKYHPLPQRVVALSTGWYNKGARCGQMVKITANNGRTAMAKVVDECDSLNGCDKGHDFQPPCRTNIVDASKTVWGDLGLNTDDGEVAVTWSIA